MILKVIRWCTHRYNMHAYAQIDDDRIVRFVPWPRIVTLLGGGRDGGGGGGVYIEIQI